GKAQHLARPFATAEGLGLEQVVDGDEVAFRLRHLAPLDLDEAVVHPDVGHHLRAVGAARLGDLVFVVGEDQVQPAAVDVEGLAETGGGQGRALDVPARTPPTPGAVPAGLLGRGQLPQHAIPGVLLVAVDGYAGAGLLLVEIALGQFA